MVQHTKKKYSFRFIKISELQANHLKKKWKDTKISRPSDRPKGFRKYGIVGVVRITGSKNYHWIKEFLKKLKIRKSKCDIFISVRTEYDTRTFPLPEYVMKVIHSTGVNITFSFVSV